MTTTFDPAKHPHRPGGSSQGGEWAPTGIGGTPWAKSTDALGNTTHQSGVYTITGRDVKGRTYRKAFTVEKDGTRVGTASSLDKAKQMASMIDADTLPSVDAILETLGSHVYHSDELWGGDPIPMSDERFQRSRENLLAAHTAVPQPDRNGMANTVASVMSRGSQDRRQHGINSSQNRTTDDHSLLIRTFEADVTVGDGRTVDVRLVPFGEVARVSDPPNFVEYQEEWLPGCFDHQLNAANRVHANYEHERGVTNIVGHGISLRSEADGYHASFRIHDTNAGNTTLELLRGDALPGVSLEAVPVKSVKTAAGIVQRAKANLRGMAFCRQGAFAGAQVLAVRNHVVFEQEDLPTELDPELVDKYRRLGLKLPTRYQAQPEQTDTPTSVGTSGDGTRHTDNHSSSEETE